MNRFRVVRFLLIGLAVLAGIVLAGSLGVRIYGAQRLKSASARFEREVGPLNLLTFVRPRVPVEENAVTWLRPGILAVVLFPTDRAVVGNLSSKPSSNWTPDDVAAIEPLLERNRPAFELLGRARGLTATNWDVPYEKGNEAKIPDLLAAMNAGKLVAARGRLAMSRGDRATAIESVEVLGTLARSHLEERVLIMLLIGSALERIQLGLVKEIVTPPQIDVAELDRLEASLGGADIPRVMRDCLRGEAASIVLDVHGDEFRKEIPRVIPRSLAIGIADVMTAAALDSRRTVQPTLSGPITSPIGEGVDYSELSWWKRLTAAYGPNIASAFARGTGTLSARELARLAIGLRRQALATGAYPATLAAPTDPMSGVPYGFVASEGGVEVRSTTGPEILRSIYPIGAPLNEQLYAWRLPSASRSTTPSPSPAGRRGGSS